MNRATCRRFGAMITLALAVSWAVLANAAHDGSRDAGAPEAVGTAVSARTAFAKRTEYERPARAAQGEQGFTRVFAIDV
jgi:hypothetical protein